MMTDDGADRRSDSKMVSMRGWFCGCEGEKRARGGRRVFFGGVSSWARKRGARVSQALIKNISV